MFSFSNFKIRLSIIKTAGLLAGLLLGAEASFAQIGPDPSAPPASLKDGLKTYLTKDSTTYLKLNFLAQTWLRFNESNPGTTVNGELTPSTGDVGLRRVRFVMSGQITPRVFVFVQFGQNSFSYLSPRKTGAFFHDVTAEYAVFKKRLSLGAGLNGWNGPSRFSNAAVFSTLGMDLPLFQEPTNDVNDQQVRKLGVYAKGKLGQLDYRLAIGKPFVTQTASSVPDPISHHSTYSMRYPRSEYHGYVMYQFWDQEGNAAPGNVGSYLGKKRVLSLGTGFLYQSKGVWHTGAAGDTINTDIKLWAVDLFYDAPVNSERGTAITAYGGYYHYDFGPGYLKNSGPMNPANGVRAGVGSFNGPGNNYAMLGTGNILYAQAGYLFKQNLLGPVGTLQPYAAYEYARFERLADPMGLLNVGVNWLVHGNTSKLSANYQRRPIFTAQPSGAITVTDHRGEYVLQYQVGF
ncbi:hypothetical protein GCM10028822_19580 [Hymenobacter terrigena]